MPDAAMEILQNDFNGQQSTGISTLGLDATFVLFLMLGVHIDIFLLLLKALVVWYKKFLSLDEFSMFFNLLSYGINSSKLYVLNIIFR
jgi:hypothetical protein